MTEDDGLSRIPPSLRRFRNLLLPPWREVVLISSVAVAFAADALGGGTLPLVVFAAAAITPTLIEALRGLWRRRVGIDAFNATAALLSFAVGEFRSAAFIALMLSSARLLEWRTSSRTKDAIRELLLLKPYSAVIERDGKLVEVAVGEVGVGEVVVVKSGGRVPVDGVIVFGEASMNESPVTGESALVEKKSGDHAISGTLVDSGAIKLRATAVGAESTVERMVSLIREAGARKSRPEKAADKFAGFFLPVVAALGLGTFIVTRDLSVTAALFLVACADDMAVAIPLAMTAALGLAASRGVIIKGGEYLDALRGVRTLVIDKTGTLTFGVLAVKAVRPESWIDEAALLHAAAAAEKFSEHPVGKAIVREVLRRSGTVPEPEQFTVYKGSGVIATLGGRMLAVGSPKLLERAGIIMTSEELKKLEAETEGGRTAVAIGVDGRFAGTISAADLPRPEAADAIRRIRGLGVDVVMYTGDNEKVAAEVARSLGITDYRAAMRPEDKLAGLEELSAKGKVAMVGDGINDAPALARADVGIAMGGEGTAVAAEAADVVILTDDLSRLPEMIVLGRKTMAVIRNDVIIWFVTNVGGFALVLLGVIGPALAAFYNFVTDFLPLVNSGILFGSGKTMPRKK